MNQNFQKTQNSQKKVFLKILKNLIFLIYIFVNIHKLKIRITDTFSIDYADFPYHLITLSPYFHGHLENIFSPHPPRPWQSVETYHSSLIVHSQFNPFSLKINAAFLIAQSGIIDIFGTFNNVKMPKMPLPPHVVFIFYVRFLRFSVFTFPFSVLQRSA